MKYKLSIDQIAKFIEIGIRPAEVPEREIKGDVDIAYLLVPTFKGDWIRQHAKSINSTWEGSYIPLIIYKSGEAVILVDYKEVNLWETLRLKIQDALGLPVSVRGD